MITVNKDIWKMRLNFIVNHCTGDQIMRETGRYVWCKDCPKWQGHCTHPNHPANREGGQKFRTYLEAK
jgi:hypothetical protein